FVGGESFVMLIPDQFLLSKIPASLQLNSHWRPGRIIWTSLVRVQKSEREFFTGARGFEFQPGTDADELVMGRIRTEEETRAAFPNCDYELRCFGRTIYPPEMFDYFGEEFINPKTGEVDLLRTFEACTNSLEHLGIVLEGDPVDLGTVEGYYHF